jgi:mannosyltransferase OCH1-like enzyme
MILYLKGGFYADLDMDFVRPLDDELLNHSLVLAEEKTLKIDECKRLNHLYPLRIANYMFGSEPKHQFWLKVLEAMLEKSNTIINNENDILETTGPGLLTNVFHTSKKNYPEIYLLENKTNLCLKKCSTCPSCHFGDYAAHLHHGSWRWQHSTFIQKQKL